MKIKQISPHEHIFTKKLEGIALMPKILYYYGELPGAPFRSDFETKNAEFKGVTVDSKPLFQKDGSDSPKQWRL